MPVIINELEIVTELRPETAAAAGGEGEPSQATAQAAATPLSPEDVESIVRFQAARASRLYAG